MNKKILTVLAILALALTTGCGCSKKAEQEPEVTVNTEEDVIKDQTVDGIEMTNTSLTTVDGVSTLLTSVTNNSDTDYELNEYTIIIKDGDGNVITTIPGYVGSVIKAGETRTIDTSTNADLSNAKSI